MKDQTPKITVIGGDLRQLEAAKTLAEAGYTVAVYGIDVVGDPPALPSLQKSASLHAAVHEADCVLLPLPYSYDGERINAPLSTKSITLTELFAHLSPQTKIAAGLLGATLDVPHTVFDYAKSETFAVKNARATVEGAIAIAIRESACTLCHSNCIVTGYGRIGKMLASSLTLLGARVTVVARSPKDRAWAWSEGLSAFGYEALPTLAGRADILFNTVPATVIDRKTLYALPDNVPVIELASLPGGVDLRAADEEGVRVVTALGLPGKYSPKTAGKIIADCVKEALL